MPGIIGALTCLLFAAHVGLGCCAHHAHGEDFHAAARKSAGVFERHLDTRHCNHDCQPAERRDHGPIDECDQVSCTYVEAEILKLDLTQNQSSFLPIAPLVMADFADDPSFGGAALSVARFVPSAELYVWHCALLI